MIKSLQLNENERALVRVGLLLLAEHTESEKVEAHALRIWNRFLHEEVGEPVPDLPLKAA